MTSTFTENTESTSGSAVEAVRMGVFVPSTKAQWSGHTDPREVVSFGVRAERTGFDSLWATDSLLTPASKRSPCWPRSPP